MGLIYFMLAAKYKDIKNRNSFFKEEIKKNILKFLFVNNLNQKNLNSNVRKKILYFYLSKSNKRYSKTKLIRRCILTNRSKVSYRKFAISRVKLRELLKYNIIPGYKKAIW